MGKEETKVEQTSKRRCSSSLVHERRSEGGRETRRHKVELWEKGGGGEECNVLGIGWWRFGAGNGVGWVEVRKFLHVFFFWVFLD